jgi:DNA-binding SARP family transcriptional activator
MIELRTLGGLELSSAGSNAAAPVLTQPRRAALLCYLALGLPRGFHRRDTLYALFWPECDTDQARHALRQSLYFLRRALCPETIVSRGDDELALAPDQVLLRQRGRARSGLLAFMKALTDTTSPGLR